MTETKKTRTPRNYDSILSGALSLTLAERVSLKKAITESITKEVADLDAAAEEAKKIAGE